MRPCARATPCERASSAATRNIILLYSVHGTPYPDYSYYHVPVVGVQPSRCRLGSQSQNILGIVRGILCALSERTIMTDRSSDDLRYEFIREFRTSDWGAVTTSSTEFPGESGNGSATLPVSISLMIRLPSDFFLVNSSRLPRLLVPRSTVPRVPAPREPWSGTHSTSTHASWSMVCTRCRSVRLRRTCMPLYGMVHRRDQRSHWLDWLRDERATMALR